MNVQMSRVDTRYLLEIALILMIYHKLTKYIFFFFFEKDSSQYIEKYF